MPNDLQMQNWNESKMEPSILAQQVDARLEDMAKKFNSDPNKFMADMKRGNDVMGEFDPGHGMASNGKDDAVKEHAGGKSGSQFIFMGGSGRRNKATVRLEQLASSNNALGLPKTYKEKRDDARAYNRIMAGGGKKSNDPMSGGGDRAIGMQARQALQSKFGHINATSLKNNPHIAKQLGAGNIVEVRDDAKREDQNPSLYRALNGTADGRDDLRTAAAQVSEEKVVQYVETRSNTDHLTKMMPLKEETREELKKPVEQRAEDRLPEPERKTISDHEHAPPSAQRILNSAVSGNEKARGMVKQVSEAEIEAFLSAKTNAEDLAKALPISEEKTAHLAHKAAAPKGPRLLNPFAEGPKPPSHHGDSEDA